MTTELTSSGEQLSAAEILLWQGRYRRNFVLLVGLGTTALKWAGVIASNSVVAAQVGEHTALLIGLSLVAAYLLWNEALARYLRTHRDAGNRFIAATVVADMMLLFGIIYVITPPEEYARGLIVSIFTVQLTQLYFGSRATAYNLMMVAIAYTVVVLAAAEQGQLATPAERLWDLALFLIGALLFAKLQGQMTQRLARIIGVFERAQDGDFSVPYDDAADQMPDAITIVGRAYNRMRVHLETIVLTDPVSGCYNRRGFDQLSTREVSRAVRGQHPLSMLAIDVDHFKRINDEFGHLTGDEVLREMGALLRETARLGDVVARIGGEEFEILAPDTSVEGARILAERIHTAFETRPFASLGPDRKITVSIGIASESARSDQVAKVLMARADEALYVAKRNGRHRTEVWHAGMRAFDGSPPGRRSIERHALGLDEFPVT
ncbi:MAG: GGDEF domain-containing protein [Gemmatimonadetes bacterium]|nr:GGDEF domain-containing protein [Gemmatimonadota bacterium]